jgi:ribosome maturation factor RimP
MARSAVQLQALADPVVTSLGYELVGIEVLRPAEDSLLRIYIDSDDGIGVSDCERVSRQLSAVFDVEDPIREPYVLEVSSPGLDRPLFTLEHFQRFVGEEAQLRLRYLFSGRRRIKGELLGVEGEDVVVREPGQPEFRVPHELIERANLVPKY